MSDVIDALLTGVAQLLSWFYELVPNYAVAIALLTCAVMIITTPLTLKGTRSMIELQRLQPEIRRMQVQYKDDRQKLNEEMMRFYREHEINPLGGCLPLLIQLPVFSILFWVIRGLTNSADFVGLQGSLVNHGITPLVSAGFEPKYLDHSSALYKALSGDNEMLAFGVDLAISPMDALGEGFLTAIPYLLMLTVIGGLAWYQQKQIMGRNQASEINPQQRMMMRLGPIMQVGFTLVSPAALGIYFLVSTAWRVAQQTYITHSLYKGEDSLGVQAQRAMAEARAERSKNNAGKGGGGKSAGGNGSRTRRATGSSASGNGSTSTSKPSGSRGQSSRTAASGASAAGSSQAKAHPRSRKKKKRK